MRTLLVEDDAPQRAQLGAWLEALGHDVTIAPDGPRGLMEHLRSPFELMLVDWVMPEMDGLQLCRRIRALPEGERPYILVVTGRDRPDDLLAVLDAGADDYVAKPASFALIQTRVRIAERHIARAMRHQEARDALVQSEADFRRVIERAPLGVVASRGGAIVYANTAAGKMFGATPQSLVGTEVADLAQPEYREVAIRRGARFERTKIAPPPMEMDLRRVDGEPRVVRCIPATSAMYRGSRAYFTLLEDITEQRQLEMNLQQADRLASVGSMAAGVAHEINNPLAYVVTNLELLRETLDQAPASGAGVEGMRGALADALDGTERVRRIVGDLKSFARSDEDEPSCALDIHSVLDVAVDLARNEIRHRATLVRAFSDVPPVRGLEGRLTQVFVNLLVNAAHAIPETADDEHRITLSTATSDNGMVEVSVEDTGCGIPADVLDRIFDPFFTTKPQGMGTGLGLSIVHGIVSQIGGEIRVQSQVGEGTRFTVCLAADATAEGRAPEDTAAVPAEPATQSMRILVVDDEPLVCEGIRRALASHDVAVAGSGREAAELCGAGEFDLVLCDVMMPDVSGMDVFARVRGERPELARRFVFMTGGAFTPSAQAFLDRVDNEQLIKPFSLRDLRSLIARRGHDGDAALGA